VTAPEPTVPAVPGEAVKAAAEAIVDRRMRIRHWANSGLEAHRAMLMVEALPDATVALEAAAPAIRRTERQRIRELAEEHGAVYCARGRDGGRCYCLSGRSGAVPFADLIGDDPVTAPAPAGNPEDSRGVTAALSAYRHSLSQGAEPRLAMLEALRAVAGLVMREIAGEAAPITVETVLEATAAERWQALEDWLTRMAEPVPEVAGGAEDIEGAAYLLVLAKMHELEASGV